MGRSPRRNSQRDHINRIGRRIDTGVPMIPLPWKSVTAGGTALAGSEKTRVPRKLARRDIEGVETVVLSRHENQRSGSPGWARP